MAETFELDIDRGRVCLDGEWLTSEDLTRRITEKVQAGDYRLSRLSLALEQLQDMLANVRTVELKILPEVLETYERIAGFEEKPLSLVLRQALLHYLGSEDAARRLFRGHRVEQARGEAADDADPAADEIEEAEV